MRAWLAVLLSVLCLSPTAEALECATETFEGAAFSTCTVDLATDDLRLWWQDDTGAPLLSLGALEKHVAATGHQLSFAMNAGMYHPDHRPVGHLAIDGQALSRVITSAGPGNFGMRPNGVLCWGDKMARVVQSRAFAKAPPDCVYATQSGPMLVIGGTLHPRFLPDSTSRRIRNGAGVRPSGRTVIFAISRRPVTFHVFARFMRDRMKTPNALYLDGSISRMFAPLLGRRDRGGRFGPILGVTSPN